MRHNIYNNDDIVEKIFFLSMYFAGRGDTTYFSTS